MALQSQHYILLSQRVDLESPCPPNSFHQRQYGSPLNSRSPVCSADSGNAPEKPLSSSPISLMPLLVMGLASNCRSNEFSVESSLRRRITGPLQMKLTSAMTFNCLGKLPPSHHELPSLTEGSGCGAFHRGC